MIFVDTAFWVAFGDRRESRHNEAVQLMRESATRGMVTTDHVRGETWTTVRKRLGHREAVGFLDLLERTARVRVVFITRELEDDALIWLRRHDERAFSFVDAASFPVMRAMRISEALTFDEDFAAAGFQIARAS